MTTFSQLVDSIVVELGMQGRRTAAPAYLNSTIRELHASSDGSTILLFAENFREEQLFIASDSLNNINGYVWDIPDPRLHIDLTVVRYNNVYSEDGRVYPKRILPSPSTNILQYFYYRTGNSYAFHNCGGIGSTISLGWYEYLPSLVYYPREQRRVTWNEQANEYEFVSSVTDPQTELRRATNWMLERHTSLLEQGLRAKMLQAAGDGRAPTAYSLYRQMIPAFELVEHHREGTL
jgi:hypothetical protein